LRRSLLAAGFPGAAIGHLKVEGRGAMDVLHQ
jgi:hypothetical protein